MKICKCPKTSNDFKNAISFYLHEKTHEEKMKNALIVTSYFEQKLISQAIEIMFMMKKKTTSVITVKFFFQKEVILKDV